MANGTYTNKTQQIISKGAKDEGKLTEAYFDQLAEIKEADVELFDERGRADMAVHAHETAQKLLTKARESRAAALEERESELKRDLFGAGSGAGGGSAFTEALTRAATAP